MERIRIADERVYAGQRLHVEEVAPAPNEQGERRRLELESEALGIMNSVTIPSGVEHYSNGLVSGFSPTE